MPHTCGPRHVHAHALLQFSTGQRGRLHDAMRWARGNVHAPEKRICCVRARALNKLPRTQSGWGGGRGHGWSSFQTGRNTNTTAAKTTHSGVGGAHSPAPQSRVGASSWSVPHLSGLRKSPDGTEKEAAVPHSDFWAGAALCTFQPPPCDTGEKHAG